MTIKDTRYWLDEDELKTPEHDEMVLWTFENAEKVLQELDFFPFVRSYIFKDDEERNPYHYSQEDIDRVKLYGEWNFETKKYDLKEEYFSNCLAIAKKERIEEEFVKFQEILPKFVIEKKMEWALPSKYTQGYLDFVVEICDNFRKTEHFSFEFSCGKGVIEEICGRNGENYNRYGWRFFFEIKPQIKSIGEVMRQINFYRKEIGFCFPMIIVTKTKGLKEIFKSQDVYVYEYNEEDKMIGKKQLKGGL
jgi:hypothetical protein